MKALFAALLLTLVFSGCTMTEHKPDLKSPSPGTEIRAPGAQTITMMILTDRRCKKCQTDGFVEQINEMLPGIIVETIDYSDEKGKKLYEEMNLHYLPAVFFSESLRDHSQFPALALYLDPKPNWMMLRTDADFDPTAEICDNEIDDTGNGLIDCADEICAKKLICQPEKKAHLSLWIMADCPYGVKAQQAMVEVLENFGSGLSFETHFIMGENEGQFTALHGPKEVEENIRQACIQSLASSPKIFMGYVWCRNELENTDEWKTCIKPEAPALKEIENCTNGDNGAVLVRKDIEVSDRFSINASPSWIANGKYPFSAIDAETIRQNICQYNPNLSGCENTLSTDKELNPGKCK